MELSEKRTIAASKRATALSSGTRLFFLGLIILLVAGVRLRLLDVPFERDEGEYAYAGQLLLQDVPPFRAVYNMKLPGTNIMYAAIMSVFGQDVRGVHLGFMIVNCITILLIYLLAKKLMSDLGALAASWAYGLLALSSTVYGFAAHATHFVVLPALAGCLLLLAASGKNKPAYYLLSGLSFGLAFLMKQPGFFFILLGLSTIALRWYRKGSQERGLLHASLFVLGSVLPFGILCVWMYSLGLFGKFWFWSFEYAARYGSQVGTAADAWENFSRGLIDSAGSFFPVWILAALGLIVLATSRRFQEHRSFFLLLALFSFFSICPGFYFRNHYFVTLLPAVALLAGVSIDYFHGKVSLALTARRAAFAASVLFAACISVGIAEQREYLFQDDPVKVSRNIYEANPFPESVEIAKFIDAETSPTDRIAVLGSEPQLYFYSKRHAATGYVYTYGLMEDHEYALAMQQEMIREIEAAKPKLIVLVDIATSWLPKRNSKDLIFQWSKRYIEDHYQLAGLADIISPELTVYRWNEESRSYRAHPGWSILIFKKV